LSTALFYRHSQNRDFHLNIHVQELWLFVDFIIKTINLYNLSCYGIYTSLYGMKYRFSHLPLLVDIGTFYCYYDQTTKQPEFYFIAVEVIDRTLLYHYTDT